MKALLAITCIAVLAGVGLYFYRDHQAGVASEARMKAATNRALCRETREGGKYHRVSSVEDFCRSIGIRVD